MTKREARLFLDGVFEEEALVIGGLLTVHSIEDAFVHRLFRSLGAIRTTALRRLDGQGSGAGRRSECAAKPHPAVEEFLARLESARANTFQT